MRPPWWNYYVAVSSRRQEEIRLGMTSHHSLLVRFEVMFLLCLDTTINCIITLSQAARNDLCFNKI